MKHAKNPGAAPIINPASTDIKIVSENCTPPSLISIIALHTTVSAVTTPIYATRFVLGSAKMVSEYNNLFHIIKNLPKERSANCRRNTLNAYMPHLNCLFGSSGRDFAPRNLHLFLRLPTTSRSVTLHAQNLLFPPLYNSFQSLSILCTYFL